MSTATGLRNWKDTAGRAVEKSSPYVKRGGKWIIVHVLAPLLFYLKEIAIAAVASLLAGCQNLWGTVIQPFLNWLVESSFRLFRWVAEETAAGLRWVWNRLTPWE
jgi:hypothetical protein